MWWLLCPLYSCFFVVATLYSLYSTLIPLVTLTFKYMYVNSVVPSRGKHVGARVQFYANSVATFQILLLISGDINPNPGPTIKNGQAILANDHILDTCTYDSQTLHSINSVCSSSSKKWCEDNSFLYGIGLCRLVSVEDGGHIEAKGADVIF